MTASSSSRSTVCLLVRIWQTVQGIARQPLSVAAAPANRRTAEGKLTVSIKDKQENVTRIERTFLVGSLAK
jgi:hypothetical protein